MFDVVEGLGDLGFEIRGDGVGESIPSAYWKISAGEGIGREGRGELTLAGKLDGVADSDGLAVAEFFLAAFAEAFVVEVLEVRHCRCDCLVVVLFESDVFYR